MTDRSRAAGILQQLMDLHEIDQLILRAERELRGHRDEMAEMEEGLGDLQASLERVEGELERVRTEARKLERAAEEKQATLDRVRSRVKMVQNERQYSAASLEFDLVRQDLRKVENQVLDKLQVVEDLEGRRKELLGQLEGARGDAGARRKEVKARLKELEDELAIGRDRRSNLAVRLDAGSLGMYDRIRSGRSEVALAPLTEESVCGNCFTSVTIQQEMQIKGLATLVCCEGCGVILYPEGLKR